MEGRIETINRLLAERTAMQDKRDADVDSIPLNEYWDEWTRLTNELWKAIGPRLDLETAEQITGQGMFRVLQHAKTHLLARVINFRLAGKLTRVIEGPYSCKQGWIRAIVRVGGRRYGWYTSTGTHWQTGDDKDKMAAASAIRRRWGPATHVVEVIEDLATVPQFTNPLHSWGCRLIEGRLYFTPYTSVAWEDIKDGQTVGFKNRKVKLQGEAGGPYTGPVWRDSSNPQMLYTDGAYWKEEAD